MKEIFLMKSFKDGYESFLLGANLQKFLQLQKKKLLMLLKDIPFTWKLLV